VPKTMTKGFDPLAATEELRRLYARESKKMDRWVGRFPQLKPVVQGIGSLIDILDPNHPRGDRFDPATMTGSPAYGMAEGVIRFLAAMGATLEIVEASSSFRKSIAQPIAKMGQALTSTLTPALLDISDVIVPIVNDIVTDARRAVAETNEAHAHDVSPETDSNEYGEPEDEGGDK